MKAGIFIALLFASVLLSAQIKQEIDLEEFAERLFQVQDDDINYEDLYESLLLYYTSPINLNKTTRSELASLYILSPIQLNSFFEYREKRGKFISELELQAVPEFDLSTIRNLRPFITITETLDGRPFFQRVFNEENNYLLLRYSQTIESEDGYKREDGTGYAGDQSTLYGRFRVSHPKDFSLGFTFEKDAGEQFIYDPDRKQYGFDFYSAHLVLQNKGRFKTIAIGDYQMQYGQGVVFGSGFGAGKGAETVNAVKRNSVGVRPYSSVLESNYFRGAAATVSLGDLDVTAFGSTLMQDANVLQSDTTYSDFEEFVNSIQATGLHRTARELDGKNNIRENNVGIVLDYNVQGLNLGITTLYSDYSNPLQRKPNNYNQFEFSGENNFIGSIYSSYNWQNFIFFSELARSSSGGTGAVGGLLVSLTSQIDFSWAARNYQKDFHSFYGNAFSEGSRNINEKGMYWGLMYRPNRQYQLAAYFDKFSSPWLKFRVNSPSEGYEYLGRFTYKPTRSIQMYAQFRQENKEITVDSEDGILSELTPTSKRNYIVNVDYAIGRTFSFKSRVQGSDFRQDGEHTTGIAVLQDVNMNFWKMKLSTRYSIFDTQDFNNRQYLYEKNVLYAFSIPAYNGVGVRSYILLQYTASRSLTFWARYSRFTYPNQDSIGSGLSAIDGNLKSDIRIMLRYKFRK
ncbi:MAG: helix-hairpin-helix domain-containing protein [Cyclobacteriaceae bacterium]